MGILANLKAQLGKRDYNWGTALAAALMKALIIQVVAEAKIAGVTEEAHSGHRNILANTLAQQAHHHLDLGRVKKLPMTPCSLQVDTMARGLENLTQDVQAVWHENY